MLGLRITLGALELVNSKGKLRSGLVSNPSQSAYHRHVPVSLREISLEARGRGKVRGMVHRGSAGRQVVKPELGDSILHEGSLREIETLTKLIPGDLDAKNLTELPQISEVILRSQRALKIRDHSIRAATDYEIINVNNNHEMTTRAITANI